MIDQTTFSKAYGNLSDASPPPRRALSSARVALGVTAALAALAIGNHLLARHAERSSPPRGRFLTVDGVRLHYLDVGEGPVLVLLHGNGSMIEDFLSSGLVDFASQRYRVIIFDRPGFGHSSRPRGHSLTAAAQADLFHAALRRLGISRQIVLGHSWGASVAAELALRFPASVTGLVLASGYHFPVPRPVLALASVPAVPVVGDVLRCTMVPLMARLMWPLVLNRIFAPAKVPWKFRCFPKEMALRPAQLRAAAAESALLLQAAASSGLHYKELDMPLVILAGEEDRLIDPRTQSGRLHALLPRSRLRLIPGAGHMVHQSHTRAVLSAIDEVAAAASALPAPVGPEAVQSASHHLADLQE